MYPLRIHPTGLQLLHHARHEALWPTCIIIRRRIIQMQHFRFNLRQVHAPGKVVVFACRRAFRVRIEHCGRELVRVYCMQPRDVRLERVVLRPMNHLDPTDLPLWRRRLRGLNQRVENREQWREPDTCRDEDNGGRRGVKEKVPERVRELDRVALVERIMQEVRDPAWVRGVGRIRRVRARVGRADARLALDGYAEVVWRRRVRERVPVCEARQTCTRKEEVESTYCRDW